MDFWPPELKFVLNTLTPGPFFFFFFVSGFPSNIAAGIIVLFSNRLEFCFRLETLVYFGTPDWLQFVLPDCMSRNYCSHYYIIILKEDLANWPTDQVKAPYLFCLAWVLRIFPLFFFFSHF